MTRKEPCQEPSVEFRGMTIIDSDFGRAECLDETANKIKNIILLLFQKERGELWSQKLDSMNKSLLVDCKIDLTFRRNADAKEAKIKWPVD